MTDTIDDWDHISERWLKELLTTGWQGDEDVICQALAYTSDCLGKDERNELISERVIAQRRGYHEDASYAWNEQGNGFDAVESLRDYWRT